MSNSIAVWQYFQLVIKYYSVMKKLLFEIVSSYVLKYIFNNVLFYMSNNIFSIYWQINVPASSIMCIIVKQIACIF